jgi:hypothetical protein
MNRALPVFFLCCISICAAAQNGSRKTDTSRKNTDTVSQKDLIDVVRSLIKEKPKPRSDTAKIKKFYFSILPVSSSEYGNGKAIITSTTAGFYLGERSTTDLSSITFTPYFNLTGRYGLPIRSNVWLNDNQWNIQGDTRFLVYPITTWGLGGNQPESDNFLINYKYVRFYQSVLKRITPYFFAGLGYDLDYYIDLDLTPADQNAFRKFTNYKYGTSEDQNSFSSGPTVNLLYDTRNNSLNPTPGFYANIIYRYSSVPLGSNNNWQSLYIDIRKYLSITHGPLKNQIAFWTYYWTSLTPGTPYLDLPSIGMDPGQRSGRGIEQSRYRGQRLFYFETEYRRDITSDGLLGFVVFSNVTSVTQPNNNRFVYWHPAGGTGLRVKFNKKSNTNICVDYGFSKNYSSVQLNLGEAF